MRAEAEFDIGDRIRGCLLGGALGDALGAPVEFDTIAEIHERFGPVGVRQLIAPGWFTDDTQMSLFTCEGLIRTLTRLRDRGITSAVGPVHHAYLRWMVTQGAAWADVRGEWIDVFPVPDGWLVGVSLLHRRRSPGVTCMSALGSGLVGSLEDPINDSKGCGGVMRAAPAGFFVDDPSSAFEVGCEVAAITHGHPSGYLPAGFLACVVRRVLSGDDLANAVAITCDEQLEGRHGAGETLRAIDKALTVAGDGLPSPERITRDLGAGWTGEEALAIGVCCAVADAAVDDALCAAVNHSGDSDSAGSICGNLLGSAHGVEAFNIDWLAALDGRELIQTMASDILTELFEPPSSDDGGVDPAWAHRYPPN